MLIPARTPRDGGGFDGFARRVKGAATGVYRYTFELDEALSRVYQYTSTEWPMSRIDHSTRTRDVLKALAADGWTVARKGPGDHVQYRHPTKPGRVTIDTGAREIPTGTLRSIYRQAGWAW